MASVAMEGTQAGVPVSQWHRHSWRCFPPRVLPPKLRLPVMPRTIISRQTERPSAGCRRLDAASIESICGSALRGIMRFLLSQFKLPTRFNPLSIFILLFIVIPVVPVHAEQWQKLDVRGYVN